MFAKTIALTLLVLLGVFVVIAPCVVHGSIKLGLLWIALVFTIGLIIGPVFIRALNTLGL